MLNDGNLKKVTKEKRNRKQKITGDNDRPSMGGPGPIIGPIGGPHCPGGPVGPGGPGGICC